MRHKLTVAVCVVAIVVVGILSVQAYNRYRVWRNDHNASVAAQQQQQAKAAAQKQAVFSTEVKNLEALCQKDLAQYQVLSTAQKAKEQAPNCSLQFVQ